MGTERWRGKPGVCGRALLQRHWELSKLSLRGGAQQNPATVPQHTHIYHPLYMHIRIFELMCSFLRALHRHRRWSVQEFMCVDRNPLARNKCHLRPPPIYSELYSRLLRIRKKEPIHLSLCSLPKLFCTWSLFADKRIKNGAKK